MPKNIVVFGDCIHGHGVSRRVRRGPVQGVSQAPWGPVARRSRRAVTSHGHASMVLRHNRIVGLTACLFLLTVICLPVAHAQSASAAAGLTLQALSAEDLDGVEKETGYRVGVMIAAVAPASPAATAGLKAGDVMFTVGNQGVASPQAVDQALAAGTGEFPILAVRPNAQEGYDPVQVTLTLGAATATATPATPAAVTGAIPAPVTGAVTAASLGLVLQALDSKDLDAIQEATGHRVGVLLRQTTPGTPAGGADLKPGDLILGVADQPVASPQEIDQLLAGATGTADILVYRAGAGDNGTLVVKIPVPSAAATPAAVTAAPTAGPDPAALYAGAAYVDPNGRFNLKHAPDWKPARDETGQTVTFSKGASAMTVLSFQGSGTPQDLVDMMLNQAKAQTQNLADLRNGQRNVAGALVPAVQFGGVNPQGVDATTEITACVAPGVGYGFILSTPKADFATAQAPWELILRTFRVGTTPAAPPAAAAGAQAGQPTADVDRRKGQVYTHPIGMGFWHPDTWQVSPQESFVLLVPPNLESQGQAPTEVFTVVAENLGGETITRPDDPAVLQFLDTAIQELGAAVPTMSSSFARTGQAQTCNMGSAPGAILDWQGQSAAGQTIAARAFVGIANGYGIAFVGMGPKDKLASRDADLRAMFTSFGFSESKKDQRLVGTWVYEKNFWSGGFSSTTIRTLTFQADGSFVEQGKYGAAVKGDGTGGPFGKESDLTGGKGRWWADNGKLNLNYEDGSYATYSYYIEDQNDGRAMIMQGSGAKQLWTYKG